MTYPYFSFFPALPLSKTLRLGEWCIGTPGPDVPWRSARFKELATAYVESFVKQGFKKGAWMWHHAGGFDGSMPTPEIWSAIHATICFVTIDANDHVRGAADEADRFATTENAALYTQPIDEEKGFLARREGGLLKHVLRIGEKLGSVQVGLPDATMALSDLVIPSQRLASALFEALSDLSVEDHRRINVALEWHRFALSNPKVVSWGQRLIALKTGFEALSGQSNTRRCGAFLRKLFEETTQPHQHLLPWAGLLWSPKERTDLARTWLRNNTPQQVVRSELEDWFAALGEQRNQLIHEGTLSSDVYEAPPERPQSRYAGPLFRTADRLLRETVKALLSAEVLLCALLEVNRASEPYLQSLRQSFRQEIEARAAASPAPTEHTPDGDHFVPETRPPSAEEDAAAGQSRDLATLLAALECDAANKVRLKKVVGQSSATLEAARESARAARDHWDATYGPCSILINRAEKDTLEAAGAEFPLPRHWNPCE